MSSQEKWMSEMMNIARVSFETGMRSLEIFQNQAEKGIEFMMKNAGLMQDESQKAFQTWMESSRNARKMYTDAIEQGIDHLEHQFQKNAPEGKK